jgi:hypothetical protein
MDCTKCGAPLPRIAVLVISGADGAIEAFAERGVDVHFCRVPAAFSRAAEEQAEEVAELLIPRRFRDLWRRDRLRAVGTTRPLLPSVLARSLAVDELIGAFNGMKQPGESEVVQWT